MGRGVCKEGVMEEYVHCPHCHRPLGEPEGSGKTVLMCPYCERLFALAVGGAGERRKASAGEVSKGPFPLILAEQRRPVGVVLLGVFLVLLGLVGVLAGVAVEVLLVMSLGGAGEGEGQLAEWGSRLRESVSVGGVAYGHEIAAGAVGVLFLLLFWSAIGMLRGREWGRVLVTLVHFVGLIGGGFLLGYGVIMVGVEDGYLVGLAIGLLIYFLVVSVYLGQKKVRVWFA